MANINDLSARLLCPSVLSTRLSVAAPLPTSARTYQVEAHNAVSRVLQDNHATLVVMPCGSGKARLLLWQAALRPASTTLVIVTSLRLGTQMRAEYREVTGGTMHSFPLAGPLKPGVTLVTAQMLARRVGQLSSRHGLSSGAPLAELVLFDEAHHAAAKCTEAALWEILGSPEQRAPLIGFTATPKAAEGGDLGQLFGTVAYARTPDQAVREGHLVPIEAVAVSSRTDLRALKMVAGDFDQKALARALDTADRNGMIVREWKARFVTESEIPGTLETGPVLKEGARAGSRLRYRRTAVLVNTLKRGAALAEAFQAEGIDARLIAHSDRDPQGIIDAFRADEFPVLVTVNMTSEGYDDQFLSGAVLADPCTSAVRVAQFMGRLMRLAPGKKDSLLMDMVDVLLKGFTLAHEWEFMPQAYSHARSLAEREAQEIQEAYELEQERLHALKLELQRQMALDMKLQEQLLKDAELEAEQAANRALSRQEAQRLRDLEAQARIDRLDAYAAMFGEAAFVRMLPMMERHDLYSEARKLAPLKGTMITRALVELGPYAEILGLAEQRMRLRLNGWSLTDAEFAVLSSKEDRTQLTLMLIGRPASVSQMRLVHAFGYVSMSTISYLTEDQSRQAEYTVRGVCFDGPVNTDWNAAVNLYGLPEGRNFGDLIRQEADAQRLPRREMAIIHGEMTVRIAERLDLWSNIRTQRSPRVA